MTDLTPSLHPHPTSGRPWSSLDGRWDFAFDTEARHPDQVDFDQSIEVPFAPETPGSGVGRCSADTVWYRRSVDLDAIPGTGDPVIHLLGVDRVADVWIDGHHVAHHRGGYGPFEATVPDPTGVDLITEWSEVVVAHRGHPAVVGWVPINESWGVEACSVEPTQRAVIVAMRGLTIALDGTRPVSANDGWETLGGDIVGVHDYDQDPAALHHRWGTVGAVDAHLCGDRPDGRLGDLDRSPAGGRAVVLSEFGGTALVDDTGDAFFGTEAWGYADVTSPEALLQQFRALWRVVHDSDALAGACWTQLTDTYQEVNGLLRSDRTPKADVARIRAATSGRPDIDDEPQGASP